ncbi:S phase cyclin A-associated protein in the endoplasmic reticulum-like [Gigantopelta aegis]|uniref:S phase cyclin A-associated protein in the endoplasmic reticulum-like n=1 Tax=Gigantopelta aegis TaxID=1735272 RepID=UPI001B88DCA1|nr:S phase cyclin A-associated protein in the endoplasmic reticulum-like [Gigantopelta aegis]
MSDSRRKRHGPGPKTRSDNAENFYRIPLNGANRAKGSHSSTYNQKMNIVDSVRKIVQEEGRTARNLVKYSVPLETRQERTGRPATRRARKSRPNSISSDSYAQGKRSPIDAKLAPKSPKSDVKKPDSRARYWKFLFDNLQRAVDAIYETCENDESEVECKEVIMMLEQSTKDFRSLIERLNLLKAYEDAAKDGERPVSIAWEVRKMSPGKNASTPGSGHGRCSPSPAQRALSFNTMTQSSAKSPQVGSWADKVRGVPTLRPPPQPVQHLQTLSDEGEDDDGWETVHRGGRMRSRNPSSQKSLENLSKCNEGQKKNLQRSKSVPDATDDSAMSVQNTATKSVSEKFINMTDSLKEWTGSKESEKKNISENGSKIGDGHLVNHSPCKPDTDKLACSKPDKDKLACSKLDKDKLASSKPDKDKLASSKPDKDKLASSKPEKNKLVAETITDKCVEKSFSSDEGHEDSALVDNELASMLDEEDSLSYQLEQEQERAIQSAIKVEESYLKEMAKEESLEIDIEPDGDDSELANTTSSLETSDNQVLDWDTLVAQYDEKDSAKKSWGEQVEEAEARTPGHGFHMHEKLSSPSRKRSPTESRRRHEEKQAKAQELRKKFLQDKADRLKELSKKVEEVQQWKEELMRQRWATIERKLHRAEEKRQSQLKIKSKKAHEEEAKANEIAFINTLEAQNKRHDILSKQKESEARLQDLMEERQKRTEEKQAKEAAVEERRKALEAERKARLEEMQEKRKQRHARIEQQQLEKEKERTEILKTKEKERQERLATLNAQQQTHIQELQKKIQQKQDESSQRHEEILQQIREKAFEMTILRHSTEDHNDAPQLTPYDVQKLCTVCNYLIPSEVYLLSHLRGKKHQQGLKDNNSGKTMSNQEIEMFNLSHIVNAPDNSNHPKIVTVKERQKALKKRWKKLRQRMTSRGLEYEGSLANKQQTTESDHKAKLQKIVKDLSKYLQSQDTGPWPQNRVSALDRAVVELSRILEKKVASDQVSFRILGGLTSLSRILQVIDDSTCTLPPVIPVKSLCHVCDVYRLACKINFENCHYMLFSNKLGQVADHLIHQLVLLIPEVTPKDREMKMSHDPLAASLMQVITCVLTCLAKNNPTLHSSEASMERMSSSGDAFASRANDFISYIICIGIIDKLQHYFNNVRGPIDTDKNVAEFLQHSLGLLVSMTKFMSKRNANMFDNKKDHDSTQLIQTFEVTELVGIVSLLYGMLLHSGAPSRGDVVPPELSQHSLSVTLAGLRMLNNMAMLDLGMLQRSLGEEGLSLEFRHIASYLIWYCSHHMAMEELLHEVILCVGYFTILNPDNQMIIQSGQPPTVLQQLCALPFQYFSDPRLTNVLFPTLVSCCYNNHLNREILEQELSCALLANFIEEKQLEAQQAKSTPSSAKKTRPQEKEFRETESRMSLVSRFPLDQWPAAQEYFKEDDDCSSSKS